MNSMLTGYLRHYEAMMKTIHQRDGPPGEDEDCFCRSCRHFRPNWKFRYCRFVECPYVNGIRTFRKGDRENAS